MSFAEMTEGRFRMNDMNDLYPSSRAERKPPEPRLSGPVGRVWESPFRKGTP